MRRSKRSDSDFSCSDEYERTVSEGTRSCAEFMSLVIEHCKSPYNLIRYMLGQFSGSSLSSRPTHVGIDKRLFPSNALGGRDDIELRGRIGDFFTFLTCYLFSTCEFLLLWYISARHLTCKLLKLNKVCVI